MSLIVLSTTDMLCYRDLHIRWRVDIDPLSKDVRELHDLVGLTLQHFVQYCVVLGGHHIDLLLRGQGEVVQALLEADDLALDFIEFLCTGLHFNLELALVAEKITGWHDGERPVELKG
jgi:hypothetical protein